MYKEIELSAFRPEREEKLKGIKRYHRFSTMLYRTDLWMHAKRVLWLLEEALPFSSKYLKIDAEKARVLALVHDDAEMITGDIPAEYKIRMTESQMAEAESGEEQAIEMLAKAYPKEVHGYAYRDLLLHALRKDCIEAELVSYLDKIDAGGETLHEILAGNLTFLDSLARWESRMAWFQSKVPGLKPVFEHASSPLFDIRARASLDPVEPALYPPFGTPHTETSVRSETNFLFYNIWKRLNIERGGEEGLRWLIEQKEFLL